jgi:DNA-binding CsgD family transcriptional regulator
MLKRVIVYGLALAMGAAALQWLEYQRLARAHSGAIYIGLIALIFLGVGVFVGARLFAPPTTPAEPGNPQAQKALGISEREIEVLREIAAGKSNKEIAGRLKVSPNTVKTHIARLYEKLSAKRRTDAIARARELGLLS